MANVTDEELLGGEQSNPKVGKAVEIEASKIPFASDGLGCPAIYADLIRGTVIFGSVTKINLVQNRQDAMDGEVKATHVAQIVIPTEQVRRWGEYFTRIANDAGLPAIEDDNA